MSVKTKTNNDLEFLNWDAPADQIDLPSLPHVQWINGQGKALAKLHPVIGSGGWELPHEVWGAYLGDSREVVEVPHSRGKVVNAYLFPCLHIATINTRFVWERFEGGQKIYSQDYTDGMTGRLTVFALVKELGDFPIMLTLKGMVGKAFGAVRKQHLNTVIKAASIVGKARGYPQYMFWMPVMAGSATLAGQEGKQSEITPPVGAWDTEGLGDKNQIAKILTDLYIGNDLRDLINGELYEQSVAWKEQYEKDGQGDNGTAEPPESDPNEFDQLADEFGEDPWRIGEDEIPV